MDGHTFKTESEWLKAEQEGTMDEIEQYQEFYKQNGFLTHKAAEALIKLGICLQSEVERLKGENERDKQAFAIGAKAADMLIKERDQAKAEIESLRAMCERLFEYLVHDQECILSQRSQGEPIPGGGYRTMYGGKWYEKTPACNCGLDDALAAYTQPKTEGRNRLDDENPDDPSRGCAEYCECHTKTEACECLDHSSCQCVCHKKTEGRKGL